MSLPPPNSIVPPIKTNRRRPNWHPDLMEPPFTLLVVAPRKSGKTVVLSNLVSRLLLDYGPKTQQYFQHIILISPTANLDESAVSLIDVCDEVYDRYDDSIVEKLKASSEEFNYEYPMLLILDDILGLLPRHSDLSSFITKNRHYNISVIVTSQHFRAVSNLIRENACGLIVFKLSNAAEMKAFSDEIIYFDDAYNDAITNGPPYSFLYLKIEGGKIKFFRNFDTFLFQI